MSKFLISEVYSQFMVKEPIVSFVILLAIILAVPILFEKLRIPGLVGLVLSGFFLNASGWRILTAESQLIHLLSDIGLIYLVFVAGLETDLKQFRHHRSHAWVYACCTFTIVAIITTFLGLSLGLSWLKAIFIGSLFTSQTLITYPLLNRLGANKNFAVGMAVGATVLTDLAALLLITVCLYSNSRQLLLAETINIFNGLVIYSLILLLGCTWAGKEYFRRSGDDTGNQILFSLLAIFIAAVTTQIIGIEKIFAAFLAGLVINSVVEERPVKEKLTFIGNTLLIPIFFVNVGLSINLAGYQPIYLAKLIGLLLVALITSKFLASWLTKLFYRYSWQETLTIWSLSLPQVSITVVAAMVALKAGVLNQDLFNSVIVVILLTVTTAPLITNRVALTVTNYRLEESDSQRPQNTINISKHDAFSIVVPIYNPQTQQYLIEMAALLARQTEGRIIPLAIATAGVQMDTSQVDNALQRSELCLAKAAALSQMMGVKAEPLIRIDDAHAQGICRAAREQKASLIVMGWGKRTGIRARLFGNVIDNVLCYAHCPVAVTRLVESPKKIQRILVPIENLLAPSLQPVEFAQILAEANQAQVTVLNVCERRTSSNKITARRSQLSALVAGLALSNPPEIQIIAHENIPQAILQAARLYDLVVLPFIRNRTTPGGLAISDVTTQLAKQLTCSIVMLGEPEHSPQSVFSPSIISTTAIASMDH